MLESHCKQKNIIMIQWKLNHYFIKFYCRWNLMAIDIEGFWLIDIYE